MKIWIRNLKSDSLSPLFFVQKIVTATAMKGSMQHLKEIAYFGQNIRRALETRVIMDHCLQLPGNYCYSIIKKWLTALPGCEQEKKNLATCEHMGEYLSAHKQYAYHPHKPVTCLFFFKKSKQIKMPNKFFAKILDLFSVIWLPVTISLLPFDSQDL